MVATRPVENLCVERLLKLEETMVKAFPFYDSASVNVIGDFGGGIQTLQLLPVRGSPNCFVDTSGVLVVAGNSYDLDATFWWDSLGVTVRTHLQATAQVPRSVQVTGARAPAPALGGDAMANPLVLNALVSTFGDTILALLSNPDSASIAEFYEQNQQAITNTLRNTLVPYNPDTDTVFYLAPPLDFLSHLFSMSYSSDVHGILITSIFDTTGARGETSFDYILGLEPDSADYPALGNSRRLFFLADLELPSGRNEMDTVAVVNTWLTIGQDTLLFYGVDYSYQRFVLTAIYEDDNSKVKKEYNIRGGQGIFAGLVVDTVVIRTQASPGLVTYPFDRTRILSCRAEGWESRKECRNALRNFCADSTWASGECASDAVRLGLLQTGNENYWLDSLSLPNLQSWEGVNLDSARAQGRRAACIDSGFEQNAAYCSPIHSECLESGTTNTCQRELQAFCADRNWDIEAYSICGPTLVLYSLLPDISSSVLQREARNWCSAHPQNSTCSLL